MLSSSSGMSRPTLIEQPTRVLAAGNKPKLIDEYIGRVNSSSTAVSVAHTQSQCAATLSPGTGARVTNRVVAERGELKAVSFGSIHTVKPEFDRGIERELDAYFSRYQTLSMASFKIGDDEVRDWRLATGQLELDLPYPLTGSSTPDGQRILADEARYARPLADAVVTVARAAPHGLDMRRAGPVTVFAIELGRLGLGDSAHQRPAERLGLHRVTEQTGLRAEPAVEVSLVAINPRLPGVLRRLQSIKYLRTVVTSALYVARLLARLQHKL